MSPRHNGDPRYRVEMSAAVAEQLQSILRRAADLGRFAEAAAAARRIHQRLRTDPRAFGDPAGHFAAAQLDLRRAAVAPLVVYYGVHRTVPQVVIREFRDLL
jgi:hypothetical protein